MSRPAPVVRVEGLARLLPSGQSERVGLWDRAKSVFGLDRTEHPSATEPPARASGDLSRRRDKTGRPPLPQVTEGSSATLDDVLAARDAGHMEEARSLLVGIDKGHGLRVVLRAAAALEAGDEDEVSRLLPAVKSEEPAWQLPLQVAAILEQSSERDALARRAAELGAPAWSMAWFRASSSDARERRQGLVDLLFEDAALARTVAARDLALPEIKADNGAVRRYAAFSHGRDVIRRFGAKPLLALLERASGR